jgi:hypothetical protein
MYLTLFFHQSSYEFISSLHATREVAEVAFGELLHEFVIAPGEPMPPKTTWDDLFAADGESPHLYEIEVGGGPAKKISLNNTTSDDVATA